VRWIYLCIGIIFLAGCQTIPQQSKGEMESRKDVQKALGAMTEAISGKQLSEEKLKNLAKDLRTNEDTQSAIQSITGSMSGKEVKIKYCPVDGQRYAPSLTECPEHKVQLKLLED